MRRTLVFVAIASLATVACDAIGEHREPWCRPVPATLLVARSVPDAALVPCVRELPQGWTFSGFAASDAGATFSIVGSTDDDDEVPARADVIFASSCEGDGGDAIRSDEDGAELTEEVRRTDPFAARWTYRFDGGCARVQLGLADGADVEAGRRELAQALSFVDRSLLANSEG